MKAVWQEITKYLVVLACLVKFYVKVKIIHMKYMEAKMITE